MTHLTLEEIQAAKTDWENMEVGAISIADFVEGNDLIIIAALEQAEKIAKGELVVSQGWQPIETAPKDGHAILVFIKSPKTGDTWQDVVFYNDIEKQFMCGTKYVGHDFITHWQPLPQPPRED